MFLIFAPKHRLCVHVRTASARLSKRVHSLHSRGCPNVYTQSMFGAKKMKMLKIFHFYNFYILYGRVFIMSVPWVSLVLN